MKYTDTRLQVAGIEVPGTGRVGSQRTRVRLSNGMYLGDVQDLSINANQGGMWSVDVVVRTLLTNQQVLELFGKIGNETTTAQAETTDSQGAET